MRKVGPAVIALGGLWLARTGSAQDSEAAPPDVDFLEYLGSWQGGDDEWLAIADWDKDHPQDAQRRVAGNARGRAGNDRNDPNDAAAGGDPEHAEGRDAAPAPEQGSGR